MERLIGTKDDKIKTTNNEIENKTNLNWNKHQADEKIEQPNENT